MGKSITIECDGATLVDIDSLNEFQGNLKDLSAKNYERLKKQIIENGFSEPISVWINDNKMLILNGHQRLRTLHTMREEGFTIPKIPISRVQARDIKQAKQKVLALTSQYGEITGDGFYEFLHESNLDFNAIKDDYRFPELDLDKFEEEYFKDEAKEAIEDNIPEIDESKIVCKLGDLWTLGNHRLLCGDCQDEKNVKLLFGENKATVWASDPPYGISYVSNQKSKGFDSGYEEIENDEKQDEELKEFIYKSIMASLPYMKKNFAFYMWHAMKMQAYFSQAAAAAAGILFHRQIIWAKPQFVFGRGHYHWSHELCLMGWLKGNEPPFYGEKNQRTVWEIGKENDKIHPTQKPIAIWEPCILNHTKNKEIVYDPFLGSGSNLIACDKHKRICYGTEISPLYCDVILQRYLDYSGKMPVREDGKTLSELKAAING